MILLMCVALFTLSAGSCLMIQKSNITLDLSGKDYKFRFAPLSSGNNFRESAAFEDLFSIEAQQIIRYAVIRNQMENNGSFDGEKKVDITAYANRFKMLERPYVTAIYSLKDMLLWGRYGVQYEYVTSSDTDSDLYPLIASADSDDYENYYSSGVGFRMVIDRYETVDGMELENVASDLEEYYKLSGYLKTTVDNLSYNYQEYQRYIVDYASENTNMRYVVRICVDGKYIYYTNDDRIEPEKLSQEYETEINSLYYKDGAYLFFDPGNMSYSNSLGLSSTKMVEMLKDYEYIYNDESKIWISVLSGTEFPVQDNFVSLERAYKEVIPVWWLYFAVIFVSAAVFLTLVVYTTVKEQPGETLKFFDRTPLEIWGILFLGILSMEVYAVYTLNSLVAYALIEKNNYALTVAGIVTLGGIFLLILYFSLIRKIKSRKVLYYSLTGRSLRKERSFVRGFLNILRRIYDRSSVTFHVLIPVLFVAGVNILLTYEAIYDWNHSTRYVILLVLFNLLTLIHRFRKQMQFDTIMDGIDEIRSGALDYQVDLKGLSGDEKKIAEALNDMEIGIRDAVDISTRDEKLKADLITNVSHDIKTPLTSIINYIDLLKRENIQNENARRYIEVLDQKAQRLKQLTEDLVEASKISSGNIQLYPEPILFLELMNQALGEFSEKFEQKNLTVVTDYNSDRSMVFVDPRQMWRIMENLLNNIFKYAMADTRVYVSLDNELREDKNFVIFSVKNISAQRLNIDASELTERFIRGDVSRSTEGSGLGLSIARNLTEAMGGTFTIYLDGDLFKVTLEFQEYKGN